MDQATGKQIECSDDDKSLRKIPFCPPSICTPVKPDAPFPSTQLCATVKSEDELVCGPPPNSRPILEWPKTTLYWEIDPPTEPLDTTIPCHHLLLMDP